MTAFALAPEVDQLVEAARRLADEKLAPATRENESAGRWPEDVLRVLDGFSLRGLDVQASLGGADIGCVPKAVVLEALATGDAGGLLAVDQPGMSAGALAACPDTDIARTIANACLSGEASCTLRVDASDVPWAPAWPPLRWVWVTEADRLSLHEIDAPGEPIDALAFHASGGVSCGLGRALGAWDLEPGAGLLVRGRARLWTAAVAVGIAQAAFDATVAYTTDRVVFGKAVAHHQGNAFELAVAATNVHGARLAVRDAASRFDEGTSDAGYWATQAWITTMDAALLIVDLGIQLLGGHGFLVDHLAEKRFREVGMLRLLAGGRDAADADLAEHVLATPDPIFA